MWAYLGETYLWNYALPQSTQLNIYILLPNLTCKSTLTLTIVDQLIFVPLKRQAFVKECYISLQEYTTNFYYRE